jgi:hypothetical protein
MTYWILVPVFFNQGCVGAAKGFRSRSSRNADTKILVIGCSSIQKVKINVIDRIKFLG